MCVVLCLVAAPENVRVQPGGGSLLRVPEEPEAVRHEMINLIL